MRGPSHYAANDGFYCGTLGQPFVICSKTFTVSKRIYYLDMVRRRQVLEKK